MRIIVVILGLLVMTPVYAYLNNSVSDQNIDNNYAYLISLYCEQRAILASYMGESKSKDCHKEAKASYSEGYFSAKDIWGLLQLNHGIAIRKYWAKLNNKELSNEDIMNIVNKEFIMGEEEPWIIKTIKIESEINRLLSK